jgi:hypothetical protein
LISKLWARQQSSYEARGKYKNDFLHELRTDAEKRDVLGLALQVLIDRKKMVLGRSGTVNYDFISAVEFPEKIVVSSATQLSVKSPELDLIPPLIFEQLFGKSVQEAELPLVMLPRSDSCRAPLTGILVYATRHEFAL